MNLSVLDLVLVFAVVLGAGGFLIWRLAFSGRKPACHPGKNAPPEGEVVVGGALARGVEKARREKARRESAPSESTRSETAPGEKAPR